LNVSLVFHLTEYQCCVCIFKASVLWTCGNINFFGDCIITEYVAQRTVNEKQY